MTRDDANAAYDFFSNRGDVSVYMTGSWHPAVVVPEGSQWDVRIRPEGDCDLKALIDRAEEGGFKLTLRMLSQGHFTVLTKEEYDKERLVG